MKFTLEKRSVFVGFQGRTSREAFFFGGDEAIHGWSDSDASTVVWKTFCNGRNEILFLSSFSCSVIYCVNFFIVGNFCSVADEKR